jgi:hypothetical protein
MAERVTKQGLFVGLMVEKDVVDEVKETAEKVVKKPTSTTPKKPTKTK